MKDPRDIFLRGIAFVRNNPQIIYTFFLLVAIPLAFFFTSEQFLRVARENQDRLERGRIGTLQEVFVLFARDAIDETALLKTKLAEIADGNATVVSLMIVGKKTSDGYPILASIADNEGEHVRFSGGEDFLLTAAGADPGNSFAGEYFRDGTRYWRSARAIVDVDGNLRGYLLTDLSMAEADRIARENIRDAYLVLLVIILLIIVLLARQARIIDYATLYQRLKEVDQMKDDFVSMAAHELRSPLTIIRGYTEMIGESETLSEKGKSNLGLIEHAASQLNTLIGDILDVAKLQEGRMTFRIEEVDPGEEIASVVESFMRPAVDKGLTLSYTPEPLPQIAIDRDRFRQVMVNFIGNAIKYTPNGSVTVTARSEGRDVVIRVSDTGLGISAEDQQRLFQKFYRVKTAETEKIVGTGLGLWITREIVRTMKGDISVESIRGKGSDFIVRFPAITKKA